MKKSTLFIAQSGLIAALYVVLTFVVNAFGLASGAIQIRISEMLVVTAAFSPVGIYGVTIGCLLANLLTGCAIYDVIFGTLATLIGCVGAYFIGKTWKKKDALLFPLLVSLPNVLANTIIVPILLVYVYMLDGGFWYFVLTVGIGEVISCTVLGIVFYNILKKTKMNWA